MWAEVHGRSSPALRSVHWLWQPVLRCGAGFMCNHSQPNGCRLAWWDVQFPEETKEYILLHTCHNNNWVRTDVRREVLRRASCMPEDKTYLLAEHSCQKNGLEPLSAQAHRCHIYNACRRHLISSWLSVYSLHFIWSCLLWCASCSNQSKRSASNTW